MDYELRINCPLCNQPVSLTSDTYADENGKAVHQECYQKRIIGALKRTEIKTRDQVSM
jgi:hypothetical protein